MLTRAGVAFTLAIVTAALAGPALGQQLTAGQIEQARAHFKAAMAAEKAGDYGEALREYLGAYDVTKDPKLFYKIANAHEQAGHRDEAVVFYRRYLNDAKMSDQAREEVKAKIAALEAAATKPPEVTRPPEVTKPPEVTPPPGETPPQPEVTTPPVGETDTQVHAEPIEGPKPRRKGWQSTAGWAAVGVAAALLTTGGVLVTSASAYEDDMSRLMDTVDPQTGRPVPYDGETARQYADAQDKGLALERYSTAAFVGAGLAAGAAIVFFVLDATAEEPEAAAAATARGSLSHLVPLVGPDTAGVSASWEF